MSVLSTPLRNEIASQKDIFRLAATIYSETSDVVSDAEAQLQIIRCMFAAIGNEYLDKNEIIAKLLDIYKYHISEDEVEAIIKKSRGVFQSVTKDDCKAYCRGTVKYEKKIFKFTTAFLCLKGDLYETDLSLLRRLPTSQAGHPR